MFRASKGQDYSDPNNDKKGREKKEGRPQRRENNPGYTAGYWQNQGKNLSETEGRLPARVQVVKIPRNG